MQKPSECHKVTSDNNIMQFKKPVHDPVKANTKQCSGLINNKTDK